MTIAFANNVAFAVYAVNGTTELNYAPNQIIAKSERNVMEIVFEETVQIGSVLNIYENADTTCETITILDDEGNTYIHLDYTIPVALMTKYVDGVKRTILQLAQLNTEDMAVKLAISAAIDEATGTTAIAQITDLQMAIIELYEIVM